ncbi:hypothetical protein LTR15_004674 [Elasticomyces elasticus]|nr:hypothetical protein LTR15_004674 [Elasticomyces elasticus]
MDSYQDQDMLQAQDEDVSMQDAPPQQEAPPRRVRVRMRRLAERLGEDLNQEVIAQRELEAFQDAEAVIQSVVDHERNKEQVFATASGLRLGSTQPSLPIQPTNPFYNANVTLQQATEQIVTYLRKLSDQATKWTYSWAPDHFRDFAMTKKATIKTTSDTVQSMMELVQGGRVGWNFGQCKLTILRDMKELLGKIAACMKVLVEYEDCQWLRADILDKLQRMERKVEQLHEQKIVDEKWEEDAVTRALEAALADDID